MTEFLILLFCLSLSLLFNAVGFLLTILPRDRTQLIRRKLSKLIFDQWMAGSWLSSRLYQWLWDVDKNGSIDPHRKE